MFTAPDEHMSYIIQLHIMSMRDRQTDRQTETETERQNSELYYSRIKILGSYLFLQSVTPQIRSHTPRKECSWYGGEREREKLEFENFNTQG